MNNRILITILSACILFLNSCGGGGSGTEADDSSLGVTVNPSVVTLAPLGSQQFTATVNDNTDNNVNWTVSTDGGEIDEDGIYSAPTSAGTYYVTATSVADPSKTGKATVRVVVGVTAGTYAGTISISKNGTNSDGDIYNETVSITGIKIMEGSGGWWGAVKDFYVDAFVDDIVGESDTTIDYDNTVQGGSTDIILYLSSVSYTLTVNCLVNATWNTEGYVYTRSWPIAIEPIEASVTDNTHLTGTANQTVTGIPAVITWDLTLQ